ncbi:hypothetical protein M422DRAFT_785169 [Sphaerobolus stellatus SS14]|uniref:Uncharacterized protein n=1 Tax=Sphaerobolus stellatus (strain SS14) TaxID=990650 RepID=A0A0C9UC31_SPHS4|nr:hypothetical protein M422DRAFT_785169 [Sphaerobolus stellatus SS14]
MSIDFTPHCSVDGPERVLTRNVTRRVTDSELITRPPIHLTFLILKAQFICACSSLIMSEEGPSSPWNSEPQSPLPEDDSEEEDEMDWEEVEVARPPTLASNEISIAVDEPIKGPSEAFEITLDGEPKKPDVVKKAVMSHAERVLRLQLHKIHTICLISNGWIRNKYLNDPLLHARLISLTPLPLQLAFTQITKKREPDHRRRGRLFEAAMMRLTQWWQETYFQADKRGSGEIQNKTFDEVELELRRRKSMSFE